MIGLDIDNVLADTTFAMLAFLNKKLGTSFERTDITTWDIREALKISQEAEELIRNLFADPEFNLGLFVIKDSVEVVQELYQREPVVYISSRPTSVHHVTEQWLQLSGFPPGDVILTNQKNQACHESDVDLFIDDNLSHARSVAQFCPVFLFNQPWNQGKLSRHMTRVENWEDIQRLYG